MKRMSNIKLSIESSKEDLRNIILKKLKISKDELIDYTIYKESIDARDKSNIFFVYTLDVNLKNEKQIYIKNKKFLSKIILGQRKQ